MLFSSPEHETDLKLHPHMQSGIS
uniref:Uncharacterized protein n=1 Tax=Nelumbo nucifera TaxID=4432 RepID=A0A822ZNC1_NELNU|nr:TPA_asm: hypothetical protein HUJ06_016658 [Nelumbo nucifera]